MGIVQFEPWNIHTDLIRIFCMSQMKVKIVKMSEYEGICPPCISSPIFSLSKYYLSFLFW